MKKFTLMFALLFSFASTMLWSQGVDTLEVPQKTCEQSATNVDGTFIIGMGSQASSVAWTDFALTNSVGFVLSDNLIVGGELSYLPGDDDDNYNIGVFANYFLGNPWYIGANVNHVSVAGEDDTAIGAQLGYFGRLNGCSMDWLRFSPYVGVDLIDGDLSIATGLNFVVLIE